MSLADIEPPPTLQTQINDLVIENSRMQKKILEHESKVSQHQWGGHTFTIRANDLSDEKRLDLENYMRTFVTNLERQKRTNARFENRRRSVQSTERMMRAPCRRNISRFSRCAVVKMKPPKLVPSTSMEYEGDAESEADD